MDLTENQILKQNLPSNKAISLALKLCKLSIKSNLNNTNEIKIPLKNLEQEIKKIEHLNTETSKTIQILKGISENHQKQKNNQNKLDSLKNSFHKKIKKYKTTEKVSTKNTPNLNKIKMLYKVIQSKSETLKENERKIINVKNRLGESEKLLVNIVTKKEDAKQNLVGKRKQNVDTNQEIIKRKQKLEKTLEDNSKQDFILKEQNSKVEKLKMRSKRKNLEVEKIRMINLSLSKEYASLEKSMSREIKKQKSILFEKHQLLTGYHKTFEQCEKANQLLQHTKQEEFKLIESQKSTTNYLETSASELSRFDTENQNTMNNLSQVIEEAEEVEREMLFLKEESQNINLLLQRKKSQVFDLQKTYKDKNSMLEKFKKELKELEHV